MVQELNEPSYSDLSSGTNELLRKPASNIQKQFFFCYWLIRFLPLLLHWCKCLTREYLPIGGSIKMVEESLKLAYGENSEFIQDKRIAAVQALSGTGACRLFAAFQQRFHPNTQIYIPVPTWAKWVFSPKLPLNINIAIDFMSLQILIFSRNLAGYFFLMWEITATITFGEMLECLWKHSVTIILSLEDWIFRDWWTTLRYIALIHNIFQTCFRGQFL